MGRIFLYRLSWVFAWRLPDWAQSIHSKLWMRVLRAQDLIDLTVASYAGNSGFQTEEHNFFGLWAWEQAAVGQYFSECRDVLVAAAGAGREMIALAGEGFRVAGFDASAELVQAGHQHLSKAGVPAELHRSEACDVPPHVGVFDALFVGRGAYHHIPGRNRRVHFLKACRAHLRRGSPVLIADFLTHRRGRKGDFVGTAFFHFFDEDEIRSELDEAGFDFLEYRPTNFPGGGSIAQAIAISR